MVFHPGIDDSQKTSGFPGINPRSGKVCIEDYDEFSEADKSALVEEALKSSRSPVSLPKSSFWPWMAMVVPFEDPS